ncbi:MAG: hypothetical protein NC084_08775 [Bacteroides sp.]|nr:hypothetical protein [Eubacterium sp.]MCM1418722.1 hypothetical protein [Roseburia sp.]MCM1462789.1 hypothetical protein [Bacteroides sp.]
MTKKILLLLTILFFAGMLFLTLFAETIHTASLPTVTTARPEQKPFPYEYFDENGAPQTGSMTKTAVSEAMLESGVYVIYSADKNGTKRDFVRLVPIQTGEHRDGYAEVISGISFSDRIVTEYDGELYDGAEVRERK